MNTDFSIYRVRHIPTERILLSEDKKLFYDGNLLITSWLSLHPHKEFTSGISVHDFQNHYKVTRFAKADGSLFQWYCDIINVHRIDFDEATQRPAIEVEDLLIDVVQLPDGIVRVVDLDEAADACERGMIRVSDLTMALRCTDKLLREFAANNLAYYKGLCEQYLNLSK